MSKERDEKILQLKKEIEAREKLLKKQEVFFKPKTNCNLQSDFIGTRINLHTLTKIEDINQILIKVNLLNMSQKDLGLERQIISGFTIEEWLEDLKKLKTVINHKEEVKKLDLKKRELMSLLSDDKKTDLLLEKIELELSEKK